VGVKHLFEGKPIIGIAGGIGSGKSAIAALFGELGCLVIDSDFLVHQAYRDQKVMQELRGWWGDDIFQKNGEVDRRAIGARVFSDPEQRGRLEGLLHPLVNQAREGMMREGAKNPQILAFVWDTPLLFETGLNLQCDKVVFVESPPELRCYRVCGQRGWTEGQWEGREKLQWPLDRKREISDYVVVNTADAEYARGQVSDVLSRILASQ
jgi:dephospho-CoA kinase